MIIIYICIYNVGGKTQINYKFIPTSLFRGCPLIRGFTKNNLYHRSGKAAATKLLIAADKTTNFYKLEPSTYNELLEKNITKSYKKALRDDTSNP